MSAEGRCGATAASPVRRDDAGTLRTFRRRARYEKRMESVVADENCRLALKAVQRNQGAAGIDRMTTTELEPHLQANGWILKDKRLKGSYIPSPVRRVEIPKPSGGTSDVRNPNGTGPVHTATVIAGADAELRPAIQRA